MPWSLTGLSAPEYTIIIPLAAQSSDSGRSLSNGWLSEHLY